MPMRVATALTGVATGAAAFLPAAPAHAVTAGPNLRPLDWRTVPNQPYWLDIEFSSRISTYQVCGWHPNNTYRCTAWVSRIRTAGSVYHVGGNKYSWDRGQITVKWDGGGPGQWDTCNTNGDYYGYASPGKSGHSSVSFLSAHLNPIGYGVATC